MAYHSRVYPSDPRVHRLRRCRGHRGFNALERHADYYKTAVGVVFAASFGIQSVTKMFKK